MRQRDLKFTFVVGEGKLAFDVVEFELEEALCEPFRPLSWVGDDAAQQVAPMAGQAFHGGGVEQVGGVVENGAKTLLFVRQVQRQVELRRPAVELHAFHL